MFVLRSYCDSHRFVQKIIPEVPMEVIDVTPTCAICYGDVNPRDSLSNIWLPCCQQSACFHRQCMQMLAMRAGNSFKCLFCNNSDVFCGAILSLGITIPDRIAYWELNLGEDWYRHKCCNAKYCVCPDGRFYAKVGTIWEIVLCTYCASRGKHIECGNLTLANPQWECWVCRPVLQRAREKSHTTASKIPSKQKERCLKGSGGLRIKKHCKHSVQNSSSHCKPHTMQSLVMSKSAHTTPISGSVASDYDIIEIFSDDNEDDGSPYGNSSKNPHFSVDFSSQPTTSGTARGSLLMSENVQGGHASQQTDYQVRCDWYW